MPANNSHSAGPDHPVIDVDAALSFLEWLRPGGPWLPVAIVPDGTPLAITARDQPAARDFIGRYSSGCNLYYSVNPTRTALNKKPSKADIAVIEYLFGDLDPNKDESPDAAKARYRKQLEDGDQKPSAVIDSGNGLQALWRLSEPIVLGAPVNGKFAGVDQAKIDDVEARTKALMERLGAKAGTQNIDRILRLPGTINLPNAVKRKAGRIPCPTRLLRCDGATCSLQDFPRDKPDRPTDSAETGANELPPLVRSLLHIANLGANQPHGGYPTRSHLLFAFLTSAVRSHVNDATITKACLDNALVGKAIYQHCVENGGHAYLQRQIKSAKKKVKEARSEMTTDLGNARLLVRLYGEDLRYVHTWRAWLIWKDSHWRRDDDGSAMRMAKAAVEEMFTEASRINDETRRNAMRSYALKCQSAQRLAAMIKLAESESEVVLAVDKLDADPYLLGVRNGVIDLRAVKFRAASRTDYITKLAGVAYDPNAQCPNWIVFLNKIFRNDDELIKYIQRAIGYSLTGLTAEEVLFVLWGHGANGKSTLRETIFAMFGDYAIGSDRNLLIASQKPGNATPDLARLHGCRLVTVNETKQNDHLDEARVKFLTSHDVITARDLYERPFDFTPTHKTWLTTNHKPIIEGTDEGIWRRLNLWPFLFKFPATDQDKLFRERVLLPELPGILNWSLDGLRAYWQNGLTPPKVVANATNEYRNDMDLIGRWIEECCELDPEARIRSADLYADYQSWAEREIGFWVKAIAFSRNLSDRGFQPGKVEGSRGFTGLKLKDRPF
jgi:P4 family phage/plasmid primase-like protien